jgi:hypothetical protein
VARDPDIIQREIEQARDALATTLDELATRANPQRVVEHGKASVQATLANPKVRYPLIGLGALIVLGLLRKLFR